MTRYLIVNGDDFGLSPGINRGIGAAYREGILTSASLMVVGDAFEQAVTIAHEHLGLSLGIHLTLVEARPVLPPDKIPSLIAPNGRFFESLGTFLVQWLRGRIRLEDVRREFEAQIERALDYGLRIDKLDSHMHLHLLPGIFGTVLTLARQYRIAAVRLQKERLLDWSCFPGVMGLWRRAILTCLSMPRRRQVVRSGIVAPDRFWGGAESGRLTEADLLRMFEHLKPGVTEVMVHPGFLDGALEAWPMSRRYQREQELVALTSPRVKAVVRERQIQLLSYGALSEGRMTRSGTTDDAPA